MTTIDLTAHCFLRSTLQALRDTGHEAALACKFERFREELEQVTDRVYPVEIPRRIRPLQDFRAFVELLKVIRAYRPDILHTYTSKAGLLGRLAAFIMRVPVIVHTIYELPQNSTSSVWTKRFYWALEKLAASWCHHLITISRVNQEQILRERICRSGRLSLIPVGLSLDDYIPKRSRDEVRHAWDLPKDSIVLGMAGRLEPVKGHSDLLQAFALLAPRYPRLHLVLMGTGYLLPQLEDQVNALGLGQRVHFLGWVEDLVSHMAALDFFVLSSRYEGLGVVLLEALVLGIPVVSTRVGGTQDIVDDGVTGLFSAPNEPTALAQAISRLMDDPEQARRMAQAGREKVLHEYDARKTDRKTIELYHRLFAQRVGPRGCHGEVV